MKWNLITKVNKACCHFKVRWKVLWHTVFIKIKFLTEYKFHLMKEMNVSFGTMCCSETVAIFLLIFGEYNIYNVLAGYCWSSWSCKLVLFWAFAFGLHNSQDLLFSVLLEPKDHFWIKISLLSLAQGTRSKDLLLFKNSRCILNFETVVFSPWACNLVHAQRLQLPSVASSLSALVHLIGL